MQPGSTDEAPPVTTFNGILEQVATGTSHNRILALETLLGLALDRASVNRLAEILLGSLDHDSNPDFVRAAALAPIPAVQERLRSLASASGDVAIAAQIGLAERGDSSVAGGLLRRLVEYREEDVAKAVARLPSGSCSHSLKTLRTVITGSEDPGVQFWAAVALAKNGDGSYLMWVLDVLADTAVNEPPRLFWGDPWSAYDEIAMAAPVPESVHDQLAKLLSKGDLSRDQRIAAGALTGLVDAEGSPVD